MTGRFPGERLDYPAAARLDLVDAIHGYPVADPYRWLEDGESAQSRQWEEQQRAVTQAYLSRIGATERFTARLRKLSDAPVMPVPVWRGDRSFSVRREPGQEHPVLHVVTSDGAERVVLDPAEADPTGQSMIAAWDCSPDGRLVAYQLSHGGGEQSVLRVMDVDSGEVVDGPIHGTRYSPIAWLPDTSGFYYVRCQDSNQPAGRETIDRRVWLHRLGDDPRADDRLIFGAGCDPTTRYQVSLDHGRWLLVSTMVGTASRNDAYLADLEEAPPERPLFRPLQVGLDALSRASVANDGRLYIHTTFRAPRGRLCVADPARPAPPGWRELVPEDADAVLSNFAVLTGPDRGATRLVVVRNRHAVSEITLHDGASGAQTGVVALPGAGTASNLSTHPDGGSTVWLSYTDHVTPPTTLRYDTHRPHPERHPATPAVTAAPATSRQETYTSTGGAHVHLFVIAPADCSQGPDRPRPTILTGYGAFGVSMAPRFHPDALAWVEAGGVFAVACVRGGGEEGRAWHRAGMRQNKHHAFEDFHAAAEWLIANGWTTSKQLGIIGASNAGLLVGTAISQRPELYAAAVCAAPLLDMTRYERFGLGPSWRGEYGSATVREEFRWLYSYSPYHRISGGARYPATMFVVYESDTRVHPMHARKMCAALQHANGAETPILFHSIPDIGHGPRAHSRGTAIGADILAFVAHHTGLIESRDA